MQDNESTVAYKPKLPSPNAFDYYYSLGSQLHDMPYESSGLPLLPREVQWLRRNQSVFRTLAQAQNKPYILPEPFIEAMEFPYFAMFRQLARAVSLQVRWHVSENDGADAVRDWRSGFKLARDLYGDTMLGVLVAVACEAVVNIAIAPHVPQYLSAREARELARTLQAAETEPDRLMTIVEGELRFALKELRRLLADDSRQARENLREFHKIETEPLENGLSPDSDELQTARRQWQAVENRLAHYIQNPAAYQRLRRDAEQQLQRHATRAFEAFALVGGRFQPREAPSPNTGDPVLDYLVEHLNPLAMAYPTALRYWETRTRRRLLALHCQLREHYLRERRYPDTLKLLPLGDWAVDPFSGELPIYRHQGDSYTLYSVGVTGKDLGGYRRKPSDPPDTPENLFVIPGVRGSL